MSTEILHNQAAERALLACCLGMPGTLARIRDTLQVPDFGDERHRLIWSAMLSLDGAAPDVIRMGEALDAIGALASAGGPSYLMQITAGPDVDYTAGDEYAAIVKRYAVRRRRLEVARRMAELAGRDDPEWISRANELVTQEKEREGEAPGWEWRRLAQAYEPKPPREYVVARMLPRPSLNIIYGPPGDLKTMLCLDLAVCIAGGQAWLQPLPDGPPAMPFDANLLPVLWVDMDMGQDRLERRLAALGLAHGLAGDSPLAYVSFPIPPLCSNVPATVDMLLATIQASGAGLVVIDNLGTVSGGADENSSQMVAVMAGLRRLAEAGSCAVLAIHHRNKALQKRARAGDALRGHSSIEGAIDLALQVERDPPGGDTINVRSTKTRDLPIAPFAALWTYRQDTAGELVRGRFFGLGQPEGGALSKQEQAELCILKDMTNGMNQTQLVDLVKRETGIGRHTALGAIRRLVDGGKLREEQGYANRALRYFQT